MPFKPKRSTRVGSNWCSSRPLTERAHQLSLGLRGAEHARSETSHSSVTASSVNGPPLEREGIAPSVIAVRAFSRIFAVSSRSLLQIHTRRGPFTLGASEGAIEPFTGLAINQIGVQIPAILHTQSLRSFLKERGRSRPTAVLFW